MDVVASTPSHTTEWMIIDGKKWRSEIEREKNIEFFLVSKLWERGTLFRDNNTENNVKIWVSHSMRKTSWNHVSSESCTNEHSLPTSLLQYFFVLSFLAKTLFASCQISFLARFSAKNSTLSGRICDVSRLPLENDESLADSQWTLNIVFCVCSMSFAWICCSYVDVHSYVECHSVLFNCK